MPKLEPTLIVFSTPEDSHVRAVLPLISSKTLTYVCDFSEFGTTLCGSISPGKPPSGTFRNSMGDEISFHNVEAIWWRRPQEFRAQDGFDGAIQDFIEGERAQFWSGFLAVLPPTIRWYNDFQNERKSTRKIFQLEMALQCGFHIPETIVTSDPAEARKFIDTHNKVICKALMGTEKNWRPTQHVTEELVAKLDHVTVCPVIFQEYISGNEDYRIIVIDDFIESVAFDMKHSRYPDDVSVDLLNRCWQAEIPEKLKIKLKIYMEHLGLRYGAFDFRLNEQGEFVFFEVNPAGEFLYLDQRANTQIAAAMATALSTEIEVRKTSQENEPLKFSNGLPFLLHTPERKPII